MKNTCRFFTVLFILLAGTFISISQTTPFAPKYKPTARPHITPGKVKPLPGISVPAVPARTAAFRPVSRPLPVGIRSSRFMRVGLREP